MNVVTINVTAMVCHSMILISYQHMMSHVPLKIAVSVSIFLCPSFCVHLSCVAVECPLCSEPTASVSRDERFSCTKCNFNMKLQGDSIGMETVVDALYDAIWQHNSKGCVCRPKFVLSENFQNSNVDLLFLSCDKCGAFNLAL
eukprot:GHVR01113600.1.p1 GENE.GHVR01113600.1~~GHVR01113600.1.p1  ORF type:complete len:143 (+),score=15.01 GHVR01113600.1:213-641(+)